jgi:hypothetical protein
MQGEFENSPHLLQKVSMLLQEAAMLGTVDGPSQYVINELQRTEALSQELHAVLQLMHRKCALLRENLRLRERLVQALCQFNTEQEQQEQEQQAQQLSAAVAEVALSEE